MSEITIYGQVLTANKEERTFTGLMLPFGETGHTSAGSVIASAGTVKLPADPSTVHLNLEHDGLRPVGKAISFEEKEDGIHATFRVAKTTAGNDLLAEIEEGLRASLSVELADVSIRSGVLLGGSLTGCGAVVRPAFPSAAIYSLTASDMGETSTKETKMENISENVEAIEASAPVQAAPIFAASNEKNLGAIAFNAVKHGGATELTAALADQLTTSDAGKVYLRDQELGEVWEARKADRPLANAIQNRPLTSLTVSGNKKNRTFTVSDWNGNKTEIPSSTYSTELVTKNAAALAGAVDIAMELIEFGSADIIADLYESGMEDYVKKSEAKVRAALLAEATAVEPTTVNGLATWDGVATTGALFNIVDDAAKRLGSIGARITHISVSSDFYSALINLPASDAPWWLQNQGAVNLGSRDSNAGGVSFSVDDTLTNGSVLVFDSRAATLFESKTFTYKALDLPKGGVDFSLIKFFAVLVTDSASVLKYIY